MMTPEVKQKWCEALRSGKYRQTHDRLTYQRCDGSTDYCVLGLLCYLTDAERFFDVEAKIYRYKDTTTHIDQLLPISVKLELIHLNDDRRLSFAQMANYIEANL